MNDDILKSGNALDPLHDSYSTMRRLNINVLRKSRSFQKDHK